MILFPIVTCHGFHLERPSNGPFNGPFNGIRKNQQLSMKDIMTINSADICINLVNNDFNIIKIGLTGALAGGFRGVYILYFCIFKTPKNMKRL